MRNSNHARSFWSLLCEMEDRDRFPELSESELTSLLDQKNSDNTKKATKVALNVFTEAKAAYGVMLLSKFEHEEEDFRNIIRIVEQQQDRNNHCCNLCGWP